MWIPLLLLILTISLATASPLLSPPPLLPRDQVCANDGKTKVGTLFTPRSLSPRVISVPPIPCFWCSPSTTTVISVTSYDPNTIVQSEGAFILACLTTALNQVRYELASHQDGPIAGGRVMVRSLGVMWAVQNANNHQVTWGVMGAAVQAVTNFMAAYGFGRATFMIYDGGVVVGNGLVTPVNGEPGGLGLLF